MVEMPISQSYRFGKNIASLVTDIVPDIVGASTVSRDEVLFATFLPKTFPDDCAILSRYNRSLIRAAITMYKEGKPFRMNRDDLGSKMKTYLWVIGKQEGFKFDELETGVARFKAEYTMNCHKRGIKPSGMFMDIVDCLVIAHERLQPRSYGHFNEMLDGIFEAKNSKEGPMLITCHGSKGTEFDTVYVLQHEQLRPDANDFETPEDWEASENLLYVAMTRARHTLYLVQEEGFENDEPKR
jgi:superfamily I DNA/RNA helicase